MDASVDPPTAPARRFFELAPLILALRLASEGRKLFLATIGLLVMAGASWTLNEYWPVLGSRTLPLTDWPADVVPVMTIESPTTLAPAFLIRAAEPFWGVVGPFWLALFAPRSVPGDWLRDAIRGLGALGWWGIVGGAIARLAVVQAATGRKLGVLDTLRFALRRAVSLIGAPLMPFLAVGLLALVAGGFGLLVRIPSGVGPTLALALAFVPPVLGVVLALILLGLAAGWPFMVATVAAEGEDAADALSRSYSYVNQRVARCAVHFLAAWAFGTLGLGLAWTFGNVVDYLGRWGTSFGLPNAFDAYPDPLGASDWLIKLVVHAWAYSYFWSAAATLYLTFRRDVDGTDVHAVYLAEHDRDGFDDQSTAGSDGAIASPLTPAAPILTDPAQAAAALGPPDPEDPPAPAAP